MRSESYRLIWGTILLGSGTLTLTWDTLEIVYGYYLYRTWDYVGSIAGLIAFTGGLVEFYKFTKGR